MRTKGKIASWNDEKGYGFVVPLGGSERTFIHIKSFAHRPRRPMVGDVITYSVSRDAKGRTRAEKASIAGLRKPARSKPSTIRTPHLLAFGFLVLLGGAALMSIMPVPILFAYLLVSSVTFGAYALDKLAASQGRWRTSENMLHLLSLVGGWPGALVAQDELRHKTKKQPFRTVFWLTVAVNISGLLWLLTPEGKTAWESIIGAAT